MDVTTDDNTGWLEVDDYDSGHGVHTEEEITEDVEMALDTATLTPEPESEEDEVEIVERMRRPHIT